MTNMFSGNINKKIPKSLKECYEIDYVARNLWNWSESLERWGKILSCVILIALLAFAIITSFVEKEVVISLYSTKTKTVFDFEVFLPLLFDAIKSGLLTYVLLHVIALLIGALATIVQNTRITANITLYTAAKAEGVTDDDEDNSAAQEKENVIVDENNDCLCKSCWKKISATAESCPFCGAKL